MTKKKKKLERSNHSHILYIQREYLRKLMDRQIPTHKLIGELD